MDEGFYRDIYSFHFNFLRYLGLWSFETESTKKRILYHVYMFIMFISGCSAAVLGVIELYLSRGDFKKVAFNMCTTCLSCGIIIKNFYILSHSARINILRRKLFNEGKAHKDPEDIVILEFFKNIFIIHKKIFYFAFFILLPLWLITSLATLIWGPREMPFSVWLPIDLEDNLQFFWGFSYHSVCGTYIALEAMHADLAMFSILLQVIAQHRILAKNISKINILYFDSGSETEKIWRGDTYGFLRDTQTKEMLRKHVQRHLELMGYVKELETYYNKPMILQLLCGFLLSVGNGLELIVVSMNFSLKLSYQVGYSIIILSDVFMYCSLASLLLMQCKAVIKSFYDLPWYDMNRELRKELLIINVGIQKIQPLTAGKMFRLDLPTFLGVTKHIYSWLALFRQVIMKK